MSGMIHLIKADSIVGASGNDKAGKAILVKNGIIQNLSENSCPRTDMKIIDFTGYVIAPFFCDYHLHFSDESVSSAHSLELRLLRSGIKKVFDGGSRGLYGFPMKKLLNEIKAMTAGAALYKKNTYGKHIGKAIESLGDARSFIDELRGKGVDYIKVINSGILNSKSGEITEGGFEKRELVGIVDYINERGLKCVCHANGDENIRRAVLAGVSAIVHGLYISDPTLDYMAERGTDFIPTVGAFDVLFSGIPERMRNSDGNAVQGHLLAMKKAVERGISVLPGSDSGPAYIPYGTAYHRELALFRRAGLDPGYILESAANAPLIVGQSADFLVVNGLDIEKIYIRGECLKPGNDGS